MAGRLAVLACVVLLSAAMANGIRTAGAVAPSAPGPAVATTPSAAAEAVPTPPVAAAAAKVSSDQHQAPLDDPYKDSKRKVPNGPDPIHNRRARWGEAPARRV
ncbi:CLAVATA3/ESR (CLE)-related protein 25-like [Panicum miliaceum]|uniref:CLAVATA3/ESR (CLE)-related protein 25-like n=1 Tax=Panicum miliaceum TaxID=4540 RepID=A0A3L6S729_PANMI|nr:CLAVATA3/ESR (CLE)-related protein 25-like [Panicum miliaceum]